MYSQSGLKRLNSSGFVFHVIKWNLWEWLDFPAKGRTWKAKKTTTCKYLLLCQQWKEPFPNLKWQIFGSVITVADLRNMLPKNSLLITLNFGYYSISISKREPCVSFEMRIKVAGVIVGRGGYRSSDGVYTIMWHLWHTAQTDWLFRPRRSLLYTD